MGTQRTTFDKLQRERAKKAKAAEKRERRRAAREDTAADSGPVPAASGQESAAELLVLIENLHKRFEAKTISFEDFEEQKADLFGRLAALPID